MSDNRMFICVGHLFKHNFDKSAQKIIDKILQNPLDTSFDIEPLIHSSMKEKLPELELAVDGYITPQQAGKLKIIKAHLENSESRKVELEELILALTSPYQQELHLSYANFDGHNFVNDDLKDTVNVLKKSIAIFV